MTNIIIEGEEYEECTEEEYRDLPSKDTLLQMYGQYHSKCAHYKKVQKKEEPVFPKDFIIKGLFICSVFQNGINIYNQTHNNEDIEVLSKAIEYYKKHTQEKT